MEDTPNWDVLLQKSESLVSQIDNGGIPHLLRNVSQLEEDSQRISRTRGMDSLTQAQLFFAQRGFDISRHQRSLRAIDLTKTYEPLEPLTDLDISHFLRHHRQLAVTTTIEDCSNLTNRISRESITNRIQTDWEDFKQDYTDQHLGFRRGLGLRIDRTDKSGILLPDNYLNNINTDVASDVNLSSKLAFYAQTIKEYNERRHDGSNLNLCKSLKTTAEKIELHEGSNNLHSETLECWELLDTMLQQIPKDKNTDEINIQRILRDNALLFLENSYRDYIRLMIRQHPTLARPGGIPGFQHEVSAYIQILLITRWPEIEREYPFRKDRKGVPFWPQVYYCLRGGDYNAAEIIIKNINDPDLSNLIQCLNDIKINKNKQSENIWKTLSTELNAFQDKLIEPFQLAVYSILCHRSLSQAVLEIVSPTTEDYLWIKLNSLWLHKNRFPAWLNNDNNLTLLSFQEHVQDLGPKHFSSEGRTPLRYFKALLMSQQFGEAVSFLSQTEYWCDALHMAIAIEDCDLYPLSSSNVKNTTLVATSKIPSSPSFHTTPKTKTPTVSSPNNAFLNPTSHNQNKNSYPLIGFVNLISKFISSKLIPVNQPVAAFHYVLLLWKHEQTSFTNVFSNLILETKEYDVLAGKIQNGQVTTTGCIYRYLPDIDARQQLAYTGEEAHKHGRFLDAILLFILAQEYNIVANSLITHLSRLIRSPSDTNDVLTLLKYTEDLLSMPGCQESIDYNNIRSLDVIYKLVQLFRLHKQGVSSYDNALMMFYQCELIPFETNNCQQVEEKVFNSFISSN